MDERRFTFVAIGCTKDSPITFDTRDPWVKSDIEKGNPGLFYCSLVKDQARFNVLRTRRGVGKNRIIGNPVKVVCMETAKTCPFHGHRYK